MIVLVCLSVFVKVKSRIKGEVLLLFGVILCDIVTGDCQVFHYQEHGLGNLRSVMKCTTVVNHFKQQLVDEATSKVINLIKSTICEQLSPE